jgi:hypothetical protein
MSSQHASPSRIICQSNAAGFACTCVHDRINIFACACICATSMYVSNDTLRVLAMILVVIRLWGVHGFVLMLACWKLCAISACLQNRDCNCVFLLLMCTFATACKCVYEFRSARGIAFHFAPRRYEMKASGTLIDAGATVPDIYARNAKLEEEIRKLRDELTAQQVLQSMCGYVGAIFYFVLDVFWCCVYFPPSSHTLSLYFPFFSHSHSVPICLCAHSALRTSITPRSQRRSLPCTCTC